jgi:hypothetical protein
MGTVRSGAPESLMADDADSERECKPGGIGGPSNPEPDGSSR